MRLRVRLRSSDRLGVTIMVRIRVRLRFMCRLSLAIPTCLYACTLRGRCWVLRSRFWVCRLSILGVRIWGGIAIRLGTRVKVRSVFH